MSCFCKHSQIFFCYHSYYYCYRYFYFLLGCFFMVRSDHMNGTCEATQLFGCSLKGFILRPYNFQYRSEYPGLPPASQNNLEPTRKRTCGTE
jgi:hypothetical protein